MVTLTANSHLNFFLSGVQETETDKPFDPIDYKISSGFLQIIHNHNFPGERKREGSVKDVEALSEFFGTELNFRTNVIEDKNASEIIRMVKELAEMDFKEFDAFLCVILSHGEECGFYGIDNEIIAVDSIVTLFKGDKCKSLVGKPKLFFIQACRGKKSDHGVETDGPTSAQEQPCPPSSPPASVQKPLEADILVAYSSCEGYESHRDTSEGSWYITELIDQLRKHHGEKNLTDILTCVNYTVAKKSTPSYHKKQMPCYRSTLTRHVFF